MGVEPKASDFQALHATDWANFPFAGSLRPLDPHTAMQIWFLDFENFLESIEHDSTVCKDQKV